VLGRPADEPVEDAEKLLEWALEAAEANRITGPQVTPFVLSFVQEHSGGRTLEANRSLIAANAELAAEVALAYAAR
jgi:pseudouridine-5'-phosphate glycosidase